MFVDIFNIIPFLQELGLILINTYSTVFNWFSYEVNLPLINDPLSVFEIMFGGGVTLFLGYTLTKWIVGIF